MPARMIVELPSGNKVLFGGRGVPKGLSEVAVMDQVAKATSAGFQKALGSLGQDLILVLVREIHDAENVVNVFRWNPVVKEIAHRVDEDPLRLLPAKRLLQFFGDEAEVEALLKWMSLYSAEAFRKSFGVAVLATGADLRAAANRIPGRVGPLD